MNAAAEIAPSERVSSPLDAFRGTIDRTKTGPLYTAGLSVVAIAMVLLPLLYMTLIGATAWLVWWHLKNDTWLFHSASGRAGFVRLIAYLGPVAIGGILIFFMVKPFFARKARSEAPVTLEPEREPVLFAFVRKICSLVGAPAPCRIDVDCQVNASASLRRGLWSRDLVLTVGLPLVSGLEMRQFAGVLAHEFGHFAQGAGMRLTYIIRHINFWFARVVYERDEWDVKLDDSARGSDWRIAVVLHAARGCVWTTRRILWALMQVGNGISCFMLRQMEFDADSYEAKVAGSDAFELTSSRLRLLNAATHSAYQEVELSWQSKRLPENLPLLIGHKASSMPAEVRQKLSSSEDSQKTGWFDTHPCDADRVQAARRLRQPGVFLVSQPATALFADFAELSKRVTRHHYEKHLALEFTDQNLMSSEEILRESAAAAEAEAMVTKFYGEVHVCLKPLLRSGDLPALQPTADVTAKWRSARQATDALREEAAKLSRECLEQQTRLVDLTAAHCLIKAGFKINPEEFGLEPHLITLGAQHIGADDGLQGSLRARADCLVGLKPFMSALGERVALAIQLGAASTPEPQAVELSKLLRLLAAVGQEMPRVWEMAPKLKAFVLLAQNRGNHSDPAAVDKVVSELAAEFTSTVDGIQARLKGFDYPFPHARGQLTVAEYARYEKPESHEWLCAFRHADAHVDRLFSLNYRLIGLLLAYAEAGEQALQES